MSVCPLFLAGSTTLWAAMVHVLRHRLKYGILQGVFFSLLAYLSGSLVAGLS
ncbi:hypothetical protein BJY00DRAFT_296826 [Aspergillus carlsbadensis]|nr:hypothetical protein BJY00DRAFT_296826 [Aspergillus carlsbadensis]